MSRSSRVVALLSLICFALLAAPVHSHGLMCTPRQRAAYTDSKCGFELDIPKDPVVDFCAHCLNGGTKATVQANLPPGGWKVYEPVKDFKGTAGRAGLCGDPKGHDDHMIGGSFMPYNEVPIVANWKKGSQVDLSVEIDTNHNGYFEFFLCNLDTCGTDDIDEKCFTGGHCYKLERVEHPDCEDPNQNTHFECGPIDDNYLGRWYLPCRNTPHVGVHIVGGPSGTMRYQLPKNVECKHCVLQWYWATANSCAPRGFNEYMIEHDNPFGTTCPSDGGGAGAHRDNMSECGGQSLPEEFWSCADVQITASGKDAGPVEAVAPPNQPTPGPLDGDEVKEDPEGVLEKAEEELKEDINEAATENPGKPVGPKDCLTEDSPCDNTQDCCHHDTVCVMGYPSVKFTCRYWWSLFRDVEAREADTKKN